MNIDQATGRLFLIGIPGTEIDEETENILRDIRPGAIILFSKNIIDADQVRALIEDVNRVLGYQVAVAIDQEGGIVTRLREGFSVSPGAMALAATGRVENTYEASRIMAMEMKALGVNWNLAPVVDINCNPRNPGIGVRSFGDTAGKVIAHATAFVNAMRAEGVMSCLKHFPGKGRVSVDAHIDLPTLDVPLSTIMEDELRPFREVPVDSMMPSHIYMPQLQHSRVPASMSREILTDLARETLGYRGILVADDLGMGGVSNYFSPEEAAVEGLRSGMDYLTYCHNPDVQRRAKRALIKAVESSPELGRRLEESLERVEIFRRKASSVERGSLECIGTSENRRKMQAISDESITTILEDSSLIPLPVESITAIYTVRLSRQIQVEDGPKRGTPGVARELAQMVDSPLIDFDTKLSVEEATKLAESAPRKGVRIVFTENAHLSDGQRTLLTLLSQKTGRLLVIALRNPYDAFIEGVKNAVLCYGYETVSQKSLIKVLHGEIRATGVLPVEVPQEV